MQLARLDGETPLIGVVISATSRGHSRGFAQNSITAVDNVIFLHPDQVLMKDLRVLNPVFIAIDSSCAALISHDRIRFLIDIAPLHFIGTWDTNPNTGMRFSSN